MIKKFIKRILLKRKYPSLKLKKNSAVKYTSIFEEFCVIGNSIFSGYMGRFSYMGDGCNINAKIGRFCSIANGVKTLVSTHPVRNFVSTSPVFYSTKKQCGKTFTDKQLFNELIYADKENYYGVIIGNDVWIGENVIIMGGICISDGAVIASGSVVVKDVPAFCIYGGVPAHKIADRFLDDEKEFLINYKWWEKDLEWLKNNSDNFKDIKKFVKTFNQNEETK